MKGSIVGLKYLVLPNGAVSGARIVLDGTTGDILLYDATSTLAGVLTPGGRTIGVTVLDPGLYTGQLNGTTDDQWIGLDPAQAGVPRLLLQLPRTNGVDFDPGAVYAATFGSTNLDTRGVVEVQSPLTTGQTVSSDEARVIVASKSADDASVNSTVDLRANQVTVLGPFSGGRSQLFVDGPVYPYVSGVAESSWHAATLQNGWANSGGTDPPAQYRMVASPPNCVHIIGSVTGGTKTNGTVIFTLPAGYRPATHKVLFPVATNGVVAGASPRMEVLTNGTVIINDCTGSTFLFFDALIPLDA